MKKKILTRERAIALMERYEEQRLIYEDGRAEEVEEIEEDGMLLPFEYMSNEDLLEELDMCYQTLDEHGNDKYEFIIIDGE